LKVKIFRKFKKKQIVPYILEIYDK
jgi:hypothetical protein